MIGLLRKPAGELGFLADSEGIDSLRKPDSVTVELGFLRNLGSVTGEFHFLLELYVVGLEFDYLIDVQKLPGEDSLTKSCSVIVELDFLIDSEFGFLMDSEEVCQIEGFDLLRNLDSGELCSF